MKCPYCDAPMSDEQVFCESCGKERQLVPVFEAEIDEVVENAISGIAVDLANTQEIKPVHVEKDLSSETEPATEQKNEQLNSKEVKKKNTPSSVRMIAFAIAFVIILVVACVLFFSAGNESSYDYHIKKAEEMCLAENYEQMLEHAEKAREIAPNSSDAQMLIARAYGGLGNEQYKREALEDLIAVDSGYVLAYDLLIPMYEEAGAYEKIADILAKCSQQSVLDKYVDYLVDVPKPSEEPGTYEEAIALKLLAPGKGEVYYTLDGSDPDLRSQKYINPILLDVGHHVVKAIYINSYQISSEIVSLEYGINAKEIAVPVIDLEEGAYTEPQYITLTLPNEDCQVYYTTDGSKPGIESFLYEHPIPLPLGTSKYAFAICDENGNFGDACHVKYTFDMQLPMTAEHARNLLIVNAVSTRYLADANGHITGMDGISEFCLETVIDIAGNHYYLFYEIFTSPDGVSQQTENHFAVDLQTGQCYRAVRNAGGTYEVIGM